MLNAIELLMTEVKYLTCTKNVKIKGGKIRFVKKWEHKIYN